MNKLLPVLALFFFSCNNPSEPCETDPIGIWALTDAYQYANADCTGDLTNVWELVQFFTSEETYTITASDFTFFTMTGFESSDTGQWTLTGNEITFEIEGEGSKTATISCDIMSKEFVEEGIEGNPNFPPYCAQYIYTKE